MKEEHNTESCEAVVDQLASDLRVIAANYFVRVAFKHHQKLLRQFDLNIKNFAKRRRSK
jgi:hypothetical protein